MMMNPRGNWSHWWPPEIPELDTVDHYSDSVIDRFDGNQDGHIDLEKPNGDWSIWRSNSETVSFGYYSSASGSTTYQMEELGRVADLAGNQDGQVTKEELEKVLGSYDLNKNGKLSKAELESFNKDMGPTETHNPGVLNPSGEAPKTSFYLKHPYAIATTGIPGFNGILQGIRAVADGVSNTFNKAND